MDGLLRTLLRTASASHKADAGSEYTEERETFKTKGSRGARTQQIDASNWNHSSLHTRGSHSHQDRCQWSGVMTQGCPYQGHASLNVVPASQER